jgi:selenide,water dikinase
VCPVAVLCLCRVGRGRIACANVLSDLYAMGVSDVESVLMILAASLDMPAEWRLLVTRQMMEGFNAAALLADCPVSGGQSILNPWAIIGGTASARGGQVPSPLRPQPSLGPL